MPDTPATWLSQFTVNPTTTGSQSGQRIVNARFLAGDQRDADIAALSGGGFVMAYQDSSALTSSLRLVERAADGSFLRSRTIDANSTANASPSDFALRIAATGSGTFSQIEIVRGSAQADTLNATGSTASITLNGGAGNDTITGGVLSGGNDADTINIGANAGNDTVTGGEGLTNDSDHCNSPGHPQVSTSRSVVMRPELTVLVPVRGHSAKSKPCRGLHKPITSMHLLRPWRSQ